MDVPSSGKKIQQITCNWGINYYFVQINTISKVPTQQGLK